MNRNPLGGILLAFVLIVSLVLLGGCGSVGTTTTPIQTQGAQDVGRDQGSAQASESGSSVTNVTPVVVNAIAAKKVRIAMESGQPTIEVEGSEDAEVEVAGANFGNFNMNEADVDSSNSSGGGSAGGTGGATRSTEGTGNRAGGNVNSPAPAPASSGQ